MGSLGWYQDLRFSLVARWRKIGLGVGFWLIDAIIISDGLITIVHDRNVYRDIVITTGHSAAL